MTVGFFLMVQEFKKEGITHYNKYNSCKDLKSRRSCITCETEYDAQIDQEMHSQHHTEFVLGSTYFSLGWGHLEARLQSCLIQVDEKPERRLSPIEQCLCLLQLSPS